MKIQKEFFFTFGKFYAQLINKFCFCQNQALKLSEDVLTTVDDLVNFFFSSIDW